MFQAVLDKILGKEISSKIQTFLLRGSFWSFVLQLGLSLLTFLTSLIIAWTTGDQGFGIYSLVFTWISLWSMIALFGLDDLLIRQIPIYKSQNDLAHQQGLLQWTNKVFIISNLLIVGILIIAILLLPTFRQHAQYYLIAALSIPFFVLMHTRQAALRGMGLLAQGQLAAKTVLPLAFILLFLLGFVLLPNLTDAWVIFLRVGAFALAALVAIFLFGQQWKKNAQTPIVAKFEATAWRKSCFYFMLGSLLYAASTRLDIVFLDIFNTSDAQIGYYNAALKISEVAMIPFMVACTVAAPTFAQLYKQENRAALQAFYTKVTRFTFVLLGMAMLFFVVVGEWCLAIFSPNFTQAYYTLILLVFTKLLHAFFGPINYLLMMCNREQQATWAVLLSVVATVLAHCICIPLWGIHGAAIGTLIGLIIFEICQTYVAYKQLNIMPTIFGHFKNHA